MTYIDEVEFEEPLWIGETGDHEYYTLLDELQAPMAVPWTEALDYSCDWASGQTYLSGALESLTETLYDYGVEYDGGTHYTSGSYSNLNLTDLLDDLSNPSNVYIVLQVISSFFVQKNF